MNIHRESFTTVLLLMAALIIDGCSSEPPTITESPDLDSITSTVPVVPTNTRQPTHQAAVATHTPNVQGQAQSNAPLLISTFYDPETGIEFDKLVIFTMHLDGKIEKRFEEPGVSYYGPVWSPDCQRIAFTRDYGYYDGEYHEYLAVMDTTGNTLVEVSTPYQVNSSPSWSPDGHRIVFHAWDGEHYQILILNLDTESTTQMTLKGSNGFPDWSPAGDWIVFGLDLDDGYGSAIFVMNTNGAEQKEIVPSHWGLDPGTFDIPGMYSPHSPKWSPDGKWIAFQVLETVGDREVDKIYLVSADGSNLHRLVEGDRFKDYPDDPDFYYVSELEYDWSPDGTVIIFDRANAWTNESQLCFADVQTGEWSCLGEISAEGIIHMDWCRKLR